MIAPLTVAHPPRPAGSPTARDELTRRYEILGIRLDVVSNDPEMLERVDDTYRDFLTEGGEAPDYLVEARVDPATGTYLVRDSVGFRRTSQDRVRARIDLLIDLVHLILGVLHERGLTPVHAGALVHRGSAVMLAGPSNSGKTTLVLGLLGRGLGLLSDEYAVLDEAHALVLPYRRAIHVRPGTERLVPALAHLADLPRFQIGGGIEWSVSQSDLNEIFPSCLAEPAPVAWVLLLEGAPRPSEPPLITRIGPAVAALELLRGTWAASVDFEGALGRIAAAIGNARCARLQVGGLEQTLDAVIAFLDSSDG